MSKRINPCKYYVIFDDLSNLCCSWNQRTDGQPSEATLRAYITKYMGTYFEPKERARLVLNNGKERSENPTVLFEIRIDDDLRRQGENRKKLAKYYRF